MRSLDQQVDEKYAHWQSAPTKAAQTKLGQQFKKLDKKLQDTFARFFYKHKVIEEMALVAERLFAIGMILNGEAITDRGPRGERIVGDTLAVVLNGTAENHAFNLPRASGDRWEVILDTALPGEPPGTRRCRGGEALTVTSRSLVILRRASAAPPAD